ncbi:MAG: aspartate aminotransferase [Ignavibacteriaceae bacterium]|jgi:aspartate aminotransferase|nr:aminotransferase class I/II-fold pyridoxal phosphate-dependent enzyme [Ignavibacteriales bacterium]MCE7857691.1 aminotransferase class I/II-fold pyridoxal phosphate-dependent enzyme [Ignavibacteria bacterium CHB3]NUM62664.1 aminotransferase class I/II-fold pyridoxal phosphate-dependent enzyme [Ignavibacteriaceae bacterium]GJQ41309.1 MAG: aspartate aminotransferase [Ignavibacteriaceae bacterium]
MHNQNSFFDLSLNLNVRGMSLSATLYINELSNKLKEQGTKIYRFGLGYSPFPVPQIVVEELRANAFQKDYQQVKGLLSLREAVADYHSRRNDLQCNAENILIGPGSKELMFLLQFVYYGDILIPTPSWVSYAPQAKIIGRQIVWINKKENHRWRLLPDDLHRICMSDPSRPRLVILNYPSNPTGVTYRKEELEELASVARKFRVIVLSDEIYGELDFSGTHTSIARFYPEGTIVSGGLSKWCGAGGWRLGTFTFPDSLKNLIDTMAAVASETFTTTSAPIQYAAVKAFKGGIEIERYLWNARKILKALGEKIRGILVYADIVCPEPDGAFYLFCNFNNYADKLRAKNIFTSAEMTTKLLEETGVAILPGSVFGRPESEFTARLAYVDFDGSRALAAAETFSPEDQITDEFLTIYCSTIIDGVEKIAAWIKSI